MARSNQSKTPENPSIHKRIFHKSSSFLTEFKEFLNEYKVIGLAVAFIIGAAATDFVKSIVNNVVMPLITPFIPGGAWQTATFSLGKVVIGGGAFLSSLINFIIIAFVVFLIAKIILREEKVTKK
jgi:large conductance mechanosensitive channel